MYARSQHAVSSFQIQTMCDEHELLNERRVAGHKLYLLFSQRKWTLDSYSVVWGNATSKQKDSVLYASRDYYLGYD